jgi:hypothetical protein
MKTYAEALIAGDAQYLGKACKKAGHEGIRFVRNKTCAACISEAQKTPNRKAQLKAYRQQPEIREYQKQYQKQYATTNLYKTQKREYRKINAAKWTAKTRKYQISKINRTPAWLTEDDHWMIEQAYELANLRTKLFGFKWHVDHVIPLQGRLVSGLHVPHNMQIIPARDNCSKSNRFTTKT